MSAHERRGFASQQPVDSRFTYTISMKINTEGRHASTENPAASGSSPCFLDTGINQRVINVPLTGIDFREIKRRPLARLSPERKMKAPETPLLLSKKKKNPFSSSHLRRDGRGGAAGRAALRRAKMRRRRWAWHRPRGLASSRTIKPAGRSAGALGAGRGGR